MAATNQTSMTNMILAIKNICQIINSVIITEYIWINKSKFISTCFNIFTLLHIKLLKYPKEYFTFTAPKTDQPFNLCKHKSYLAKKAF